MWALGIEIQTRQRQVSCPKIPVKALVKLFKEYVMSLVKSECECCGKKAVLEEFGREWEVYGQSSQYNFMFCAECMEDKEDMFIELMRDYE